ncbi:unnamed protein product, partial [Vitis vinifera]|uniref:Uncharacterized protein n=1 Tax=Vitis vinifera TaxID=29760 RepID=E0CU74_VITVI
MGEWKIAQGGCGCLFLSATSQAWAELSKDWLPSDLQPPPLHTFYISVSRLHAIGESNGRFSQKHLPRTSIQRSKTNLSFFLYAISIRV